MSHEEHNAGDCHARDQISGRVDPEYRIRYRAERPEAFLRQFLSPFPSTRIRRCPFACARPQAPPRSRTRSLRTNRESRLRFETPSHPVNLRTGGRTDISILSENARLSAIRSCLISACRLAHFSAVPTALSNVGFSNRPFGVKRFQTTHPLQCRCRSSCAKCRVGRSRWRSPYDCSSLR